MSSSIFIPYTNPDDVRKAIKNKEATIFGIVEEGDSTGWGAAKACLENNGYKEEELSTDELEEYKNNAADGGEIDDYSTTENGATMENRIKKIKKWVFKQKFCVQ